MKLHIDVSSNIYEVQDNFQQLFPGLKLEFLFNGHEDLLLSAHLGRSFPHIRINEFCPSAQMAFLDIEGRMTVKEVENLFRQQFGLPAQVYVKEGIYWLKGPAFDSRTLQIRPSRE